MILPDGKHTVIAVYSEMLLQILADLPGIGSSWQNMELDDIEWFYDGLRSNLRKITSPKHGS